MTQLSANHAHLVTSVTEVALQLSLKTLKRKAERFVLRDTIAHKAHTSLRNAPSALTTIGTRWAQLLIARCVRKTHSMSLLARKAATSAACSQPVKSEAILALARARTEFSRTTIDLADARVSSSSSILSHRRRPTRAQTKTAFPKSTSAASKKDLYEM